MLFLFNLGVLFFYFLIMILFMVAAIASGKSKVAWVWYSIGAILQLMSLSGNQKVANMQGKDTSVEWGTYFVLLIISAVIICIRYKKADKTNNLRVSIENNCTSKTENNRMEDSSYPICIFDVTTNTLRKEKKNIDVTKFPPSKFADNNTYYAIETFRNGKKIRIYHTKDNWDRQKGIERQEAGLLEETNIDGNVRKQGISHKEQIMILCKQCGTEILSDSIFCRKCGTKVEDINKEFFICIFDATTHNLRKEKKNIDVTKIPPSKFADNDTYYAIETFKDGKKIRTYLTKDNWNKQIEIGISE